MKLYETLVNQLKKENNFVTDEGELKKWVVIGKARNYDPILIKLLLKNETLKEKFFVEVEGALVFKQEEFITFMEMKNYLNDSYTQYKNKVGLTIDGKYLKQRNDVALVWPFKDCILEGGQSKEEQKREEIFFNEILAQDEITQLFEPKVLTNAKVYAKDGEHEFKGFTRDAELNKKRGLPEDTITDNLIIKGNNLLALHSLKKEFAGKVKLIYIDPPYNPESAANTFSYNNNFNHSSWLTFMKNRLEISRKLLTNDGFLCMAIDHNELFYIGILGDEIFGRDNRIAVVAVETNPGGRSDAEFFATSHEYFIVYAKNKDQAKINDLKLSEIETKKYNLKDNKSVYKLVPLKRTGSNSTPDKRPNLYFPIYYNPRKKEISLEPKKNYIKILPLGSDSTMRVWRWSKKKILNEIENIEIKKTKGVYTVYVKDRIKYGKKPKTLWHDSKYDAASHGTKLLQKLNLPELFSYPKSIFLVTDILQILTDKNAIVLDFHAGSGTTAHAVLELNKEDGGNRQFILVEQMDYIETVTVPRVQKVLELQDSDSNFTYFDLKKYNQAFTEKIQEAKTTNDLLAIWEQMKERSFLNYNVDLKKQEEHIEEFKQLNIEEQKKHLVELLDKNQLYVNLSSMNDKDFEVSEEEKQVTKEFYNIV